MEPRISLVTLGVVDVARSRRFYEAMGWKASGASVESTVFFQLGGMALALYGRKALAGDAGLIEAKTGFGGVMLAQNMRSAEAVDGLLDEAERAGARILQAGHKVFWGGYVGYFADLDEHVWEVAWNPGFVLEADGTLRLPD